VNWKDAFRRWSALFSAIVRGRRLMANTRLAQNSATDIRPRIERSMNGAGDHFTYPGGAIGIGFYRAPQPCSPRREQRLGSREVVRLGIHQSIEEMPGQDRK
jgi:hypothetical protein